MTDPIVPLPPLPDVIAGTPREVAATAAHLLTTVEKWAPDALAAADFFGAITLRRRILPFITAVLRGHPSPEAVLDAQQTMRTVERTIGLTLRAGQQQGLVRMKGEGVKTGKASARELGVDTLAVFRMAAPSDEEFAAAVRQCRDRGSLSWESLFAAFGPAYLTAAQREQRERLATLAAQSLSTRQIAAELGKHPQRVAELCRRYAIPVPGNVHARGDRDIDPVQVITEIIPVLDGLGSAARTVDTAGLDRLDPAQAQDWARAIRASLIPIVALQKALRIYGKKA